MAWNAACIAASWRIWMATSCVRCPDKALGALRLAVADNEHLRDVLRLSEDPKRPERKIQFYIAVYQHLRERIRQDIIRTDDPVEAIEQMEIELGRLTEELTAREQKLAISSKSVANIIRKTIQRTEPYSHAEPGAAGRFLRPGEERAPERQCAKRTPPCWTCSLSNRNNIRICLTVTA